MAFMGNMHSRARDAKLNKQNGVPTLIGMLPKVFKISSLEDPLQRLMKN